MRFFFLNPDSVEECSDFVIREWKTKHKNNFNMKKIMKIAQKLDKKMIF